jgi:hypothetical protein
MTVQATLRLFCPGSDFVDLVVFERRDVLDNKGQRGVDSVSDGVDAGSFEDEIEPLAPQNAGMQI